MAIKKENVIYEISAEADKFKQGTDEAARSVKSLDTQAKETSKGSQRAFDEMGKSAKAYTEKLTAAEREQKKLSQTIREQERISQDFRSELVRINERLASVGKNTVQFQRLTKEANNLRDALKDNNTAIQGLKLDQRQNQANINELKKLKKAAEDSGKSFKEFSGELGNLAQQSVQLNGPLGNVQGLLTMLGPVGLAAGAAIGVIGGAFLLAKDRLQEFSDRVDVFTAGQAVKFGRLADEIGQFFVDVIDKGFFKAFEGKNFNFFSKEYEDLRKSAEVLEDFSQFVNRKRIQNIRVEAKLEREIQEAREQYERNRLDGVVNLEAINAQEEKTNLLYAIRIKQAKAEADIITRRNKQLKTGNEGFELQERALARVEELEAERLKRLRELTEQRRTAAELERKNAKNVEEELGFIQRLKNEIEDLNKEIAKAPDETAIVALTRDLVNAEKALKDFETFYNEFKQSLLNDANKTELQPIPGLDFQELARDGRFLVISQEQTIDGLNKKIAELQKTLRKTPINTQEFAELNNEILRLQEILNNVGKLKLPFSSESGKDQSIIDKERLQQEAQQAADVFIGLSRTILAEDIARKDRQIELQRERLNEFRRIAENGNAEQLQLEEERLAGLIEARERFAQRERQLSALQIAAANARAVAEGISATISGFKDGNVAVGIANALALAAAVGATIVAVRNSIGTIPAFEKGTEDTGRNGRGVDGKGGFHAILHPGERVVSAKENARLRGIKNEKLPEIVDFYRANNARMKVYKSESKTLNIDELIATTERTNRLLESLNIYADINEYGLQAGISRAQTKLQRKRNLAR